MRSGKILISLFLVLFAQNAFSYTPKEGNISVNIGPYIYKTNFSGSSSGARSPYLSGVAMIVQGDFSERSGLEIGIMYLHKNYFRETAGAFIAENSELMHITMGYHYWITSRFSTSLSFYSAYSMGSPKQVHSDFVAGTAIDTSASDSTEYGFDLSLQLEVWSREKLSVVVDTRYSRSVTPKINENADHYGAIIALSYLFQEKYPTLPTMNQPQKK